MQGPKKVAFVLLALMVLAMGFADYWGYSKAYHLNPADQMDVVAGTALAPNQYRVGVILPAWFVASHTHLGLRHVFTGVDVAAGLVAVFSLFFLLRRSAVYQSASSQAKWFGAAAFLFLVQFYLPWVTWYQRPETLTSVALVALSLLLLTVRVSLPGTAGYAATACALLLLAAAQGFVRADVAFGLHAGVFLLCLTRAGHGLSLPRGLQRAVSGIAVVAAAGIQYYLMHVVYPHATYGDSPVFELILNFKEWERLIAFSLFIPPYVWMLSTLLRQRPRIEAPSLGLVFGSVTYMGMWWCVGRVEEVRIFLPFALGLAPLTAELAMRWLNPTVTERSQDAEVGATEKLLV